MKHKPILRLPTTGQQISVSQWVRALVSRDYFHSDRFELSVLKFTGDSPFAFNLHLKNAVTNGVKYYLTEEHLEELLDAIQTLPPESAA